jgi:hypothetical protein
LRGRTNGELVLRWVPRDAHHRPLVFEEAGERHLADVPHPNGA